MRKNPEKARNGGDKMNENLVEKDIENEENDLWEEGGFTETLGPKDIKERMGTFHKKHNEDMNFNCTKCSKKISAHNKDWHNGMCDNCFNQEYY